MADEDDSPWRKPSSAYKIKKLRTQKRALQDRLFDCESPSKKTKRALQIKVKDRIAKSNLPQPPDDSACDDSTLMDILGLRPIPGENTPKGVLDFSKLLSSPQKPSASVTPTASPIKQDPVILQLRGEVVSKPCFLSPLKQHGSDAGGSPSSPSKDHRRILIPRRLPLSPSFSPKSKRIGRKPLNDLPLPSDGGPEWNKDLCLDWSLKSGFSIISPHSYGWSSNNLKTSEESSGVSAFVRCIDIEPPGSTFHPSFPSSGSSQLDTSLGAQFHQCCLYWQHPSIPTVILFPREVSNNKVPTGQKLVNPKPPIRFEKSIVDSMHSEWIEAFRSAFQLVKARQCPFFYICMNSFTCLFCSAGTQGDEQTQIYITPSTKVLRDALTAEKINFSLPYAKAHDRKFGTNRSGETAEVTDLIEEGSDVGDGMEDDAEKWKGVSQDKNPLRPSMLFPSYSTEDKNATSLLLISGSDTLLFFNFLMNSRTLLIATVGPFAGVPPTILSPVAFHGATLKSLKVEQRNLTVDSVPLHSIDMKGPILPHVIHMLTSLLNKTVKNYKIRMKTLESTIPLNIYSNMNQVQGRVKPSAFDLQNLSDCGLKRAILEVFCKCDNCDTILEMLEGKRGMYRWH